MLNKKDISPHLMARTIIHLQRALALVQSRSAQRTVLQLEQSFVQLLEVQQELKLRVQWTPEQVNRQQERLDRQEARLQWQRAMLQQLREQ